MTIPSLFCPAYRAYQNYQNKEKLERLAQLRENDNNERYGPLWKVNSTMPDYYRDIPDMKPYVFQTISDASYINGLDRIQSFVDSKMEGIKVLDSFEESCWQFVIYEHKNKYLVGCRGTYQPDPGGGLSSIEEFKKNALNWTTSNIPRLLGAEDINFINCVDRQINDLILKHSSHKPEEERKLYGTAGHSGGGWIASRIGLDNPDIYRITFNGAHPLLVNDRTINLRLTQDKVSLVKTALYITVGEGGHSSEEFWRAIHPDTDFDQLHILPISERENPQTIPKVVHLAKGLTGENEASTKNGTDVSELSILPVSAAAVCIANLKSKSVVELEDPLQKQLAHECLKSVEVATEKLDKRVKKLEDENPLDLSEDETTLTFLDKIRSPKGFLLGASILTNILSEMDRSSGNARQIEDSIKHIEDQLTLTTLRRNERQQGHRRDLLLSEINHFTNSASLIKSGQNFLEAEKKYIESLNELRDSLQSSQDYKVKLRIHKEDRVNLTTIQKLFYKKALHKRAKCKQAFGFFRTALNGLSTVLSVTPAAPVAAVTAMLGNQVFNHEEELYDRTTGKLVKKFSEVQQNNVHKLELLEKDEQLNDWQIQQKEQRLFDHQQRLIYNQSAFTSVTHREELSVELERTKALSDVKSTELEAKRIELARLQSQTEEQQTELDRQIRLIEVKYQEKIDNKIKGYHGAIKEAKRTEYEKKYQKDRQKEIDRVQRKFLSKLTENREKILRDAKDIELLTTANAQVSTTLTELSSADNEANKYAKARLLRDKFNLRVEQPHQSASEGLSECLEARKRQTKDLINPYTQTADALSHLVDIWQNPTATAITTAVTHGAKASELIFYLKGAYESVMAIKKDENLTFFQAFSKLDSKVLITGVLIPGIQLLSLGIMLGKTIKRAIDLCRGKKFPTEFEMTLTTIKEVGEKVNQHISQCVKLLDERAENRHKDLVTHFGHVFESFGFLERSLKDHFTDKCEDIKNIIYATAFHQHVALVDKNRIKICDDLNNLGRDFRRFPAIMASKMACIVQKSINGYAHASVESIPSSFFKLNPEIFTGRIAQIIQLNDAFPNWDLLETLVKNFRGIFLSDLIEKMELSPKLLPNVLNEAKKLYVLHGRIGELFNIKPILDSTLEIFDSICSEYEGHIDHAHQQQQLTERILSSKSLEDFKRIGKPIAEKNFLGSRKYRIYNESKLFPTGPYKTLFSLEYLTSEPSSGIVVNSLSQILIDKLYDDRIKILHANYLEFLEKTLANQPLPDSNLFYSHRDSISILASNTEKLPPLIFPKNLLQNIELMILDVKTAYESTQRGYFVYTYDFSEASRKLYICCSLHKLDGSKPLEFRKFNVATLDALTMDSYLNLEHKVFFHERSKSNYSLFELLIDAVCSSFNPIGLPGKGSVRLRYKSEVAAVNTPFKGFYNIWSNVNDHPGGLCRSHIGYHAAFEAGTEESLVSSIETLFCEGNGRVVLEAKELEEKLTSKKGLYKQKYNVLQALMLLLTNLEESEIDSLLQTQLGMVPPEHFDRVYSKWALGLPRTFPSTQNLQNVLEVINVRPSERVNTYYQHHQDLEQIIHVLTEINSTTEGELNPHSAARPASSYI